MRFQTNRAGQVLRAAVASVVVACTTNFAAAETLTLRDGLVDEFNFFPGVGYAGTSDESIFYFSGANDVNNHWMRTSSGASGTFRIRGGSTNVRLLMRYDLSTLVGDAVTINSATLRWTQTNTLASGFTGSLFRIAAGNAGWQEGTGVSLNPNTPPITTSTGDATFWYKSVNVAAGGDDNGLGDPAGTDTVSTPWLSGFVSRGADGTSPGTAQGGLLNSTDLVSTTAVATAVRAANVSGALSYNLPVAMVQSWINAAATNAGMLATSNLGSGADFAASENGTAANRPTLILDITTHRTLHWDVDGAATPGAGGLTPSGTWDNATLNFNTDSTGGAGGRVSGLVTSGDTVVFSAGTDATGAYAVTLPASRSAAKVVFNQGNVTLNGGGSLAVGIVEAADGITGVIETQLTGGGALAKTGGGTVRLAGANTYTGGTTVSAGTLVLANADATAGGAVSVADGALAQVQASLPKAVTLTTLATNTTGKLDVTNNSLVIKGMADAAVRTLLQTGYNGGGWNGATGIVTTSVSSETSVGYATNAQLGNLTEFKGVTGLASSDVLVKYTYAGDANLDGKVDIGDLGLLAGAWQQLTGKVWFDGDFTYDGAVDIGDLGLLAGNWQKGTAGNPNPPLMTFNEAMAQFSAFEGVVVPEPTGLALLGLGGLGALGWRRRRA